MIKPWIFEFAHPDPAGSSDAGAFDWLMRRWVGAEAAGFEGIFFSEHHFRGNALSPSPHLLIAAVAMRTERMRLGVMGDVLPLHTPWRVAEELMMLDHLTHGRLEIGYSSGAGPMETTVAGIPLAEVRPRYEEAMEIIERGLTEPSLSHDGRFWKFNTMRLSPRPLQNPLPQRWITVVSAGSAAGAARRGHRICTGFLPIDEVTSVFDAYRAASSRPCGPEQLGLRRQVFIGETDTAAQEASHQAAQAARAIVAAAHRAPSITAADDSRATAHTLVPDAPKTSPLDMMFAGAEQINGTPGHVAEQIIEQCRQSGAGHIMAYTFATHRRADIDRSDALWRQVIPVLRAADIGQRRAA